jgi:ZIP family zinc transporter
MNLRSGQVPRMLVGGAIVAAGLLVFMDELAKPLNHLRPSIAGALGGGAMAALATAAGTLPVLFAQNLSKKVCEGFLGLGAGIMLAATSFSLVIPALAASRAAGAGAWQAAAITAAAILLGMALVMGLDRFAGAGIHVEEGIANRPDSKSVKRAWLFVAAIAIHNLPEGLAIGVAYAGVDPAKAYGLATGISLQDIPEGLVVAMALRAVGYGRVFCALLGVASGIIEPIAAVAGAALIEVSAGLLPWGLACAGGAMLYVICHHIIPESHKDGHNQFASAALVAGFVVMMVLDTALA